MTWILLTLFAAFMQAVRNALQKSLSQHLSSLGVALARFIFAWPLALIYLILLYHHIPPEKSAHFSTNYYLYILGAGLAQIIATLFMVALFRLKNYAIGVGLARSEAILAAIIAFSFLNVRLNISAWIGIILGTIAIFLLSGSRLRYLSWKVIGCGLASGLGFALTSLWVREAALCLNQDPWHAAAWVLFSVIFFQTLLLTTGLAIAQKNTLKKLWAHRKNVFLTSLVSCLGSFAWFSAMRLEEVALVKTLGQIEILFMLAISHYFFKEKLQKAHWFGLLLIVLAALCVIWASQSA